MRHEILQGLHEDHINMSRIAGLVAAELAAVESGEKPDLALLEDVMAYVTAFPDTVHHPTEDILFAQLKRAVPEAQHDIDALLAEHGELIAMGRTFLRLVVAVEGEAVVTRAELLAKGRAYLDLLTAHMNKEEMGLFRLAADRLNPADWATIGTRIEAMEDPLFGPAVAADYRRLWQRIMAYPPSR